MRHPEAPDFGKIEMSQRVEVHTDRLLLFSYTPRASSVKTIRSLELERIVSGKAIQILFRLSPHVVRGI